MRNSTHRFRGIALLSFAALSFLAASPCRAADADTASSTGRTHVLSILKATAEHYRSGRAVRLEPDTFPYHDWFVLLWERDWRRDSEIVAVYDRLRRAVRRKTEIEPFEYLVDALTRQARRGDTVAMADLLGLYRGSDAHFTETVQEGVIEVFNRNPAIVVRAWCAQPPAITIMIGDERAVARARARVMRLVTAGRISESCGRRFLESVETW